VKLDGVVAMISGQPWALSAERWAAYQALIVAHANGREIDPRDFRARYAEREVEERTAGAGAAGIGVIPIYGDLVQRSSRLEELLGMGTSTERVAQQLRALLAEPAAKAIVLDFHSPGGTVYGAHELHTEIRAARGRGKRIVACVNSLCASAAYWAAAGADEIVMTAGGDVGSIGVFCAHVSVAEALVRQGIKVTIVKAGKYKAEGDTTQPLGEEARRALQARADAAYALFTNDVASARGVSVAAVRGGYGEGRTLGAKAALAAGMVDRIATFRQTVDALMRGRTAPASTRAQVVGGQFAATSDVARRRAELDAMLEIDDRKRRLELDSL
jgi:signal peptide peptidase SppA